MYLHTDYPPSRPGHAEDGQGFSAGTTGLVGRFAALPFRQLAGPAAVFFWWPPRPGRTASDGRVGGRWARGETRSPR
jgi:hypothetical protein